MSTAQADRADSVDTLVAYIEGLGTQFSCFDSCLQGEPALMDTRVTRLTFSQLQGGR